jgi:hypothetical protein
VCFEKALKLSPLFHSALIFYSLIY